VKGSIEEHAERFSGRAADDQDSPEYRRAADLVVGHVDPNPDEPFCSPEVDDPATVGVLADAFTDEGYALTAVEMVAEQVGVLVAERQ
jgi:hypothetical protein